MKLRTLQFEKAFTLIEIIIAMSIISVIFAVMIPQISAMRNSWAGNEASAEMLQNGRVLSDHIQRYLGAAKGIISVSSSGSANGYIEFTDNADVIYRYQFSSGYVEFGPVGSESQLAGPVDKFQVSCYSLSDFSTATTDVNNIRFVQIETNFTNSTANGSDKTVLSDVYIQSNNQVSVDQPVIDAFVKSGVADTAFDYVNTGSSGTDAVINVDGWDSGSKVHALLWFKDVVGSGSGQVPANTVITSAILKLWYVNSNSNAKVYFYRMTKSWDETATWNSLVGGVNPGSNADLASKVTARFGYSVATSVSIDVTSVVQGWINGDYPNYGWGIINSSSNGLEFAAIENTTGTGAHTPTLEINYNPAAADPGVAVKQKVDYGGNNAVFDSYRSSQGFYGGSNISSNAVVSVNATGSNKIVLYSNATLNGDAYIGPGGNVSTGIREWSGSVITGVKGTLAATVSIPNISAPTGIPYEGTFQIWGNMSATITTNRHFNNMYLWGNSQVTISGDVTILVKRNLSLGNNAKIKILSGSSLNLYVRRNCNIGGTLNAYYDKDPSALKIYIINNNKNFNMYGKAEVYGLVQCPKGKVTIWNATQFYGRMKAKRLEGNGGVHIDLDSTIDGSGSGGTPQSWIFGGGLLSGGGSIAP